MIQSQDNSLSSKVELSIACRNLKNMDVFSKSDPMAVLYQKLENQYFEIGRTEIVKNNLNPKFSKTFEIDYHFEERQIFKIDIYDIDSSSSNLSHHDFLGNYEFSLGEMVSRKTFEAKLTNSRGSSGHPQLLILTCQELPSSKESINLQFSGMKLDKKDFLGKSDPILELYRCNDPIKFSKDNSDYSSYNNFTRVYQSKPIMNTLNPSWPAFNIKINRICFGDKDRVIKLVSTDWNFNGSLDFIGQCFSSVNQLMNIQGNSQALELINPKKKSKKRSYKNSGTLTVHQAALRVDYTFIDYISGGTDLLFTVAIDFTASNGVQTEPISLHYIHSQSGSGNQYEVAIRSVGSIIQDYDSFKMFPAMGFGARIPPHNEVSHCFPINFCAENPFCAGVEGILSSYWSAIRAVKLFGPTNFAPSIRHVQRLAQSCRDGSKYFVLLIITDGIITDLDATIDAIIDCSFFPMSIIIIGVGNEDFSAMDMLDCDKGVLRLGNKTASRDIVQFVAMRSYMQGHQKTINQTALSKAVLFELPGQITSWMQSNGICPLPPTGHSTSYYGAGESSQLPSFPNMANQSEQISSYPPRNDSIPNATSFTNNPRQFPSRVSNPNVPPYPSPLTNPPPNMAYPITNVPHYPSPLTNPPPNMAYPNTNAPPYPMQSGNSPSRMGSQHTNVHPYQPINDPTYVPSQNIANNPGQNAPPYPLMNNPMTNSPYPPPVRDPAGSAPPPYSALFSK